MRQIVSGTVLLTLVVTLNAGQLTLGDWDFTGLESFPTANSTNESGWSLEVDTGDGIEIVEISHHDWGQYDIIYTGIGLLHIFFFTIVLWVTPVQTLIVTCRMTVFPTTSQMLW